MNSTVDRLRGLSSVMPFSIFLFSFFNSDVIPSNNPKISATIVVERKEKPNLVMLELYMIIFSYLGQTVHCRRLFISSDIQFNH